LRLGHLFFFFFFFFFSIRWRWTALWRIGRDVPLEY